MIVGGGWPPTRDRDISTARLAFYRAVKGQPNVEIVTVSVSNRDELAEELARRFR